MQILTTILGLIGISGLILAILKFYLDKRIDQFKQLSIINEKKYRTLLIYMSIVLDSSKFDYFQLDDEVLKNLPMDQKSDFAKRVLLEYTYHSVLYSSDNVVKKLLKFIDQPTYENYIKVAISMRSDLWAKKTHLNYNDFMGLS